MSATLKLPTPIFENIFLFPPNRDTLGGSSYLIVEPTGNVLVDAPAIDDRYRDFLADMGGVKSIFLTHRGGIGRITKLLTSLEAGLELIIQEQEAYLIPEYQVTTFGDRSIISDRLEAIWTPGHSPGSSCLFYDRYGGILFSGRHIIPDRDGRPLPIKNPKTFHWKRQLQNFAKIQALFPPDRLRYICPGSNIGGLRGRGAIDLQTHTLTQSDLNFC
jgi:glyoxylase-like metal-dependent hydrolase (beta-lactamase superfamily II)